VLTTSNFCCTLYDMSNAANTANEIASEFIASVGPLDSTWLASPSQARRELDRAGLYTDLTEEFPGADPVALSDALTLLATRWGL